MKVPNIFPFPTYLWPVSCKTLDCFPWYFFLSLPCKWEEAFLSSILCGRYGIGDFFFYSRIMSLSFLTKDKDMMAISRDYLEFTFPSPYSGHHSNMQPQLQLVGNIAVTASKLSFQHYWQEYKCRRRIVVSHYFMTIAFMFQKQRQSILFYFLIYFISYLHVMKERGFCCSRICSSLEQITI